MRQIKLTQGKVALIDDSDYAELSKHTWYALKYRSGDYYAVRNVRIDGRRHVISMARQILGLEFGDKRQADHRDHVTLDNRKDNLRVCTRQQNMMNRKPPRNTISQFKGVSWHKAAKKWKAQITVAGESIYLGFFVVEINAALVYDIYARKYYKEFAYLNFPPQYERAVA